MQLATEGDEEELRAAVVVDAGTAVGGGRGELLGDGLVGAQGDVAELARVGEGAVVVVEGGEALALHEPEDGLHEVFEPVWGWEAEAEGEVERWGGGGGFGHGGFG